MNVEMLRKVGRYIVANPTGFDLRNFYASTCPWGLEMEFCPSSKEASSRMSSCGSVMCIAGWTEALNGGPTANTHENARLILGLSIAQSYHLFYGDSYGWIDFGGWNATAQQAQARIEHFIANGGTL